MIFSPQMNYFIHFSNLRTPIKAPVFDMNVKFVTLLLLLLLLLFQRRFIQYNNAICTCNIKCRISSEIAAFRKQKKKKKKRKTVYTSNLELYTVTKSLFLVEISHGMAYDRTNAFTDRSW
jgi:hypothetical protein